MHDAGDGGRGEVGGVVGDGEIDDVPQGVAGTISKYIIANKKQVLRVAVGQGDGIAEVDGTCHGKGDGTHP